MKAKVLVDKYELVYRHGINWAVKLPVGRRLYTRTEIREFLTDAAFEQLEAAIEAFDPTAFGAVDNQEPPPQL